MNRNFPEQFINSINSDTLALSLIESFKMHGSADDFIIKMQNHFRTSYNGMYGLSVIANSVVEVSSNYGNNTHDGPFLQSSTIALSGIEVFVGMNEDQKSAVSRLQLQNVIKPDFEDQVEIDEYATNIMDMGYDGFYSLSPELKDFYYYYENDRFSEVTPDSYIEKSRAGFGFPYSIIDKVIKTEDLEVFKTQIESDIDWDAEFDSLSSDNNEN
jgi:hypothetical protein